MPVRPWELLPVAAATLLVSGCSLVTDFSDLNAGSDSAPVEVPAGWLKTSGHEILWWDGQPFRGRGVNLHDTRSCWSCAWEEPNPSEVERRLDWVLDEWQADFVRLNLESYPEGGTEVGSGAIQWRGVLDDPQYLADIQSIVRHIEGRERTALLLTLWVDPTLTPTGTPTDATRAEWELLAETFAGDGHVVFGLVDGPSGNPDGVLDEQVWEAMNETVASIRAVEERLGVPPHLIAVQGTREGGADLSYYVEHPILAGGGKNVVYEVHVWDSASSYASRFLDPARELPVFVGAFGPVEPFTLEECGELMDLAEAKGLPYLAWTFHTSCTPSMVAPPTNGDTGCLVDNPLDELTDWGALVKSRLAVPR